MPKPSLSGTRRSSLSPDAVCSYSYVLEVSMVAILSYDSKLPFNRQTLAPVSSTVSRIPRPVLTARRDFPIQRWQTRPYIYSRISKTKYQFDHTRTHKSISACLVRFPHRCDEMIIFLLPLSSRNRLNKSKRGPYNSGETYIELSEIRLTMLGCWIERCTGLVEE